jgi:hypothetical protein
MLAVHLPIAYINYKKFKKFLINLNFIFIIKIFTIMLI